MNRLTGQQLQQLQQVLLHAYPNRFALAQLLRIHLDENLDSVAGGVSLQEVVFNLIIWAEACGRLDELIIAAHEANPGNASLNAFVNLYQNGKGGHESRSITVLFLAANPTDTARLRVDKECRSIDEALRKSAYRNKFTLRQQNAVRVSDLTELLLRYQPDIVHFSGHGDESGAILVEDESGQAQPVSGQALADLLEVLKDNVRCVILSACFSASQARAIAQQIDCVIGMSDVIADDAALNFATSFYAAVGYGRDVKTAFDLGCVGIDLAGGDEQHVPQLIALHVDPKTIVFGKR